MKKRSDRDADSVLEQAVFETRGGPYKRGKVVNDCIQPARPRDQTSVESRLIRSGVVKPR